MQPIDEMAPGSRQLSVRERALENFDAAKYCRPGEITIQEVQDMKAAFDMIDEDKSGQVDAHEVVAAAVAIGLPIEENIHILLGDSKIDFDEFFRRMTAKLEETDTADEIMAIFEMYDNDRTGTISFENMVNIAKQIGAKETHQEIQNVLNILDTDGDQELDPMDFYTCCVSGLRLRLDKEKRQDEAQQEAMISQLMPEGAQGMYRGGLTKSSSAIMGGSRMMR
jgi:centrin-1